VRVFLRRRALLIVVAKPQQNLEEISLRYLGRFDQKLFEEIYALNPELKDLHQIEAGRLILLPRRAGKLIKKVLDTAEVGSVPKEGAGKTGPQQEWQAPAANQTQPEFTGKRREELFKNTISLEMARSILRC
jgi:hypothetical protein